MQQNQSKPAIWLITIIALVPQLSEAIYTPALPEIADSLKTSIQLTEHTLAIYLLGFAFGVFLWGTRADAIGRRPTLLMGYGLFCVACMGCYASRSIESLLFWRFIQGLGGAVGSVGGQTIARDSFTGKQRGVVFSTIGMVITLGPALGPVVGGMIVQNFHWSVVFIILMLTGAFVWASILRKLPETHPDYEQRHQRARWATVLKTMIKDPQVLTCGFIVGGLNGIAFSMYSEGPFYFIEMLKISPTQYGMIYPLTGTAGILGSLISRHLNKQGKTPIALIYMGLKIQTTAIIGLTLLTWFDFISVTDITQSLYLSVALITVIMFPFGLTIPNALSLALTKYGKVAGTAGALFGGYYYSLIALFAGGMGIFRNGTLLAMPLYFCGISIITMMVFLWNRGALTHDHSE